MTRGIFCRVLLAVGVVFGLLFFSRALSAQRPVDNPPMVNIASPFHGGTVSGVINVTADAGDDEAVTHVDFFIDGWWLATDTEAPYSCSWETTSVSDGPHAITATATDTMAQLAADTISITVGN